MKKKIIALSLLALTVLIAFFSTGLVISSSRETVFGPFVVQEMEHVAGEPTRYKEVQLNVIGIMSFLSVLSVPVFGTGYLWGQSNKNKESNQSSDPT